MEHSIVENYSLPIQWSVMLEVERSFNHQNQSPHWSLLLLESTAIKWLKYYTNKAISCFYSQRLITKPLPSTQQWLTLGPWQLVTHTSAAPWAFFPLCYTSTTTKLLCLHCTIADYRQKPLHLPPIVGWEQTTARSRCSQTPVVGNASATYSCQADSCGNLVWNIFPVDMTNSRAGDVLHATSTHPYLWNSGEAHSVLALWRKMKKKRLSSNKKT